MASVESLEDAALAQSMGWRTFRVDAKDSLPIKGEALCPASDEAGNKLTCAECLACAGSDGRRGNVMIPVHGSASRIKFFDRRILQPQTEAA